MLDSFLPFLQRSDHDCAVPLAQGVMLLHTGKRWARKDMLAALGTTPELGTAPHLVELCFRRSGLKVISGEFSIEDLRWQVRRGRPVLCLVTLQPGVGHWVAVLGVRRRRVHYYDPAQGAASLPEAEWAAVWWDADKRVEWRQYGLSVAR